MTIDPALPLSNKDATLQCVVPEDALAKRREKRRDASVRQVLRQMQSPEGLAALDALSKALESF